MMERDENQNLIDKCFENNSERLNLSRKGIKALPQSIGKLATLRYLILHSNRLT